MSKFSSLSILFGVLRAEIICSLPNSIIALNKSSSLCFIITSDFSLPISSLIVSIKLQIDLISSCAKRIAFKTSSSLKISAPASTIIIASFVPDTVILSLDFSLCAIVGFIIYSPSTYPTLTDPVGPLKGISEIVSAIEEPIIASISGWLSCSTDNAVAITWTSFLYPSGKSGRNGLSISLEVNIDFSLGRPSLLINPPGIFPTE